MGDRFTESEAEAAALAWLESLGYAAYRLPSDAPGEPDAQKCDKVAPGRVAK